MWATLWRRVCLPIFTARLRRVKWFVGVALASAALLFFLAAGRQAWYRGRVLPGVRVGSYNLGGLSAPEVKEFIEQQNNSLAREGIRLAVDQGDKPPVLASVNVVGSVDSNVELARWDSDVLARQALLAGRTGSWWERFLRPLWYRWVEPYLLLAPVAIETQSLQEALESTLSNYTDAPRDAGVTFPSSTLAHYQIIPEKSGTRFNHPLILQALRQRLAELSLAPLPVAPEVKTPEITTREVEQIAPLLATVFGFGDIKLNYVDPDTEERHDWRVPPTVFAEWLVARRENSSLYWSLQLAAVRAYLTGVVQPAVDRPPEEAKFVMADSRVQEFTGSRRGRRLKIKESAEAVRRAFEERVFSAAAPRTVGLEVATTEPRTKIAGLNDFGIAAALGVGKSSFKGSPPNRIKNILTAAKRLNGILVKPGEEFSAHAYLGPYTRETGYLPELVIKGRQIKPEIGGGLCQFGSTLFRMAMNAGLPITERRNHSLVVPYYADPVNGNPGTDATLYDPRPDFKFLNDTNNYLLVQTAVDLKRQTLAFTLWGTPDGRKGWYSPPTVSRWIPAGEPQTIEVSDGSLKPGERKCQHAYRGAAASFTYSRITPVGEKIDSVFDSYYRPLPEICLVGVAPSSDAGAEVAPPGELGEPVAP